jgi:hypothetical protein
MLAYLDHAPDELGLRARLALLAARTWAMAMNARRCPLPALARLCARWGVPDAAWSAHCFFQWTFVNARKPLTLGCPCCGRVGDDEAQLLAAILNRDEGAVHAALSDVVRGDALNTAVRLAGKLRASLRVPEEP